MKKFVDLIAAVDQVTDTNAKLNALVRYLSSVDDPDALWATALLCGRHPRRTMTIKELRACARELVRLPDWLLEESRRVVGDLVETLTLSLPPPTKSSSRSLSETIELVQSLEKVTGPDRDLMIHRLWLEMQPNERFVLNKLLTGGFRAGVPQQLLVKALVRVTRQEQTVISHRLSGSWLPERITLREFCSQSDAVSAASKPYPFLLASELEGAPNQVGDVTDWQIEWKFDGLRAQCIVRNGQFFLWSRSEDVLTEKFPEFQMLKNLLPEGTVIDGTILAFNDGKVLPPNFLQRRINRKRVTRRSLSEVPTAFIAYDILEYKGEDIRHLTLSERRALLKNSVEAISPALILSPILRCGTWLEADRRRSESRDFMCKGLMLKRKASTYEVGRRHGSWWKWSAESLLLKVVLVYAECSERPGSNLYRDFTFAVWSGDELVPVAKASEGLSEDQVIEIDAFIRNNTVEKFGPVRGVTPQLVFEIAFEGINPSPRRKSGVALHAPRIKTWHRTMTARDANTREDLHRFLVRQPGLKLLPEE